MVQWNVTSKRSPTTQSFFVTEQKEWENEQIITIGGIVDTKMNRETPKYRGMNIVVDWLVLSFSFSKCVYIVCTAVCFGFKEPVKT